MEKKGNRDLWVDEELLLTLYIYLTHNHDELNKSSLFLRDFCERLNSFTGKSRTLAAIEMRISNYKSLDSNYGKKGLNNVGKNVKDIWNKYSKDLKYLQELYFKFINMTFKPINQTARNEIVDIENELKSIKNDADRYKIINIENEDAFVESLISIRNGAIQKIFRDNLIMEFNHKCALCDINNIYFLIASHILPYSRCINKEDMINHNNGLLLCPIHDALFDKKYISFNKNGKIIISKSVDKNLYYDYNISEDLELDKKYLTDERLAFLKIHNELFEEKNRINLRNIV